MSGTRRLIVGDITLDKGIRGKALADGLARQLNSEETVASSVKKTVTNHAKSRRKK